MSRGPALATPTRAIRWARGRLSSTEFGAAIVMLMGGTALAQAIGIAASPILTRLYSPAEFGEFTVALSLLAVMASVSTLSYSLAIPLPHSDVVAANVMVLCFVIIAAVSLVLAVVMLFAGGPLLSMLGAESLASYALLVVLGQLAIASVATLNQWMVRTKNFSQIAFNSLIQSIALVGGQIVLGIASFGAVGLLGGQVIGRTAGSSRLARAAWKTHQDAIRQVSWRGVRAAASRYRRFALLSTPSTLLNTLGLWLPFLLLTAIFGTTVGGQFALAERVIMLPGALVALAAGQVFTAQAAILAREDRIAFRRLYLRSTRLLFITAIGPAVALAVTAPFLFGFVFGAEWTDAGYYVTAMTPWLVAYIVANPTGGVPEILERQELRLFREIIRFVILVVAGGVIVALGLEPFLAVLLMSFSIAVMYIIYGLISWRSIVVWQRMGVDLPSDPDGV